MKKLKTFLILFYTHRFFNDFVLLYPVYVLLFESKGLSVFEISLLLIIWNASVMIFEVPTGILADRIGRRLVIVAGTSCKLICFIIWLFSQGFFLFAVGFVFWGLQEALCSGSTEALLYDTLKVYGREHDYERISGSSGFYAGVGIALSMLLGGYAASLAFDAAILASIFSVAAATAAALGFKESYEPRCNDGEHQYFNTLKNGLLQVKNNKTVLALILFSSLVIVVPGILEEYDQLYVENIGLSLWHIGIWGALRTGAESLGSRFAYKFKPIICAGRFTSIFTLAGGVLLLISVYFFSVYSLTVYALFYFINAVCHVLSESVVQREISSENRATTLSVSSLLFNLSGMAYTFFLALASESFGLRGGFLIMAAYTVFASLLFFIVFNLRVKR